MPPLGCVLGLVLLVGDENGGQEHQGGAEHQINNGDRSEVLHSIS